MSSNVSYHVSGAGFISGALSIFGALSASSAGFQRVSLQGYLTRNSPNENKNIYHLFICCF